MKSKLTFPQGADRWDLRHGTIEYYLLLSKPLYHCLRSDRLRIARGVSSVLYYIVGNTWKLI